MTFKPKPIITIATITLGLLFARASMAENVPFASKAFTDVSASGPNYTAIEYLRTQNIVRGYLDGTFEPNNLIRRSEFLNLVTNPFFLDQSGTSDCVKSSLAGSVSHVFFTDVSSDDWFAQQVCIGETKNIIDGYPDHTFRPKNPVTFAESAKMMATVFLGNDSKDTDPQVWYKTYVKWLADAHAIPTSIHRLDQPVTRAQVAEMLYRLKTKTTTKASVSYSTLVH